MAKFSTTTVETLPMERTRSARPNSTTSLYTSDYIPSDIGTYVSRAKTAQKVTREAAQKIYDNGGIIIGRVYHSGGLPSGASYGDWGYTVMKKENPQMGGYYYSTPTWDRYGPHTHDVFGVSGVQVDYWKEIF